MKLIAKLRAYGALVMFSHSIFSLPFAVIAMLWAALGLPHARTIFWILVALLGARNGANAFNRIADVKIDAANPRTAARPLQRGSVKLWEAWALTLVCFALAALAAWMLAPICLLLLPVAVAGFVLYSYAKRVTWLCHFLLGACCGGAPLGAWLAVTGRFSITALLLAGCVCLWVAGFDIIYATQDIAVDCEQGLHSLPARFGKAAAMNVALLCHSAAVGAMLLLYFYAARGGFYLIGVLLCAGLLVWQNIAARININTEFAAYKLNQAMSGVFLVFSLADFFFMWR